MAFLLLLIVPGNKELWAVKLLVPDAYHKWGVVSPARIHGYLQVWLGKELSIDLGGLD